MPTLERVVSLVGNLYTSDNQTRNLLDPISLATYGLTKLFSSDAALTANTADQAISLESATFAEFFFARVDIPEGGDCSFKLKFPGFLYVPATWAVGTEYDKGDQVNYLGTNYVSLVDSNSGNTPDASPSDWLATEASPADTEVVVPCNGGELWLNKTKITGIKVSSTSGANILVIGGSRT